ncbi:MAG: tetratricopeptide repeat protein [Candidatus Eremiobacteraeota bacterium]|nr:tetratricopeptide repeat protein [Candidatus Eremiobacteraeota bacterium]
MFNLRKLTAFFAPGRPATSYERAVRLLETGAFEQAERELSALVASAASDSERAAVINKRGIARVHQNRRDEALEDFTAALEFKPQFASALLNIGNLLLEDGELDEAIAHYESAVRSDDSYAVAHMNLSAAYKKAGRHAESVREFRRASRLEGRFGQKKKATP